MVTSISYVSQHQFRLETEYLRSFILPFSRANGKSKDPVAPTLEQLQDLRFKELRQQGDIKAAEAVELSTDEYRRLLADLFIAKFPHLAKRSLFGAQN